ncbi:MAG TPA: methionyl-tRNA formyltransferase [Gammaproteobacteria bacterium]|nr:methionyl-tRNA formyltransferase [Gammaproteobacteria bacterium]
MRLVFAGTPEFAATILAALLDSGHRVACVYTQPDRPAGRGRKLRASPVKALAARHHLPVLQPSSLRAKECADALAAISPDLMVVAAYGLLLPPSILSVPSYGCINVHASLLPRWRGAAPIQRAILAGDEETGISIMQMDEGLDTGGVLASARLKIEAQETAGGLSERLARLGATTLLETLDELSYGPLEAAPQDDARATLARRVEKQEAELDWSLGAVDLERRVRAFNPWPVAYTYLPDGGNLEARRLRVWQARSCPDWSDPDVPGTVLKAGAEGITVSAGSGALLLTEIQVPGSRVMSATDFLNARPIPAGAVLGRS